MNNLLKFQVIIKMFAVMLTFGGILAIVYNTLVNNCTGFNCGGFNFIFLGLAGMLLPRFG